MFVSNHYELARAKKLLSIKLISNGIHHFES